MKILIFLIFAVSTMFLVTTCCDDCPVCPKPEVEEHLFYIAPRTGNMVKIFSVEREAIIDSFVVDSVDEEESMKIHVIGDDSLLAVTVSTITYVLDLSTREVLETFDGYLPTFSRNSRFYVCRNDVFTFPEHEIVHDETEIPGTFATFCNQSEMLSYWSLWDDHSELGLYFVYGDSVWHDSIKYQGNLPVETFFLSFPVSSLKKTFIDAETHSFFGVCDFGNDTLRKIKSVPWGGVIPVVAPDDKYVFFTDVCQTVWGYIPTGYIFVYDADTEDSLAAIKYEGVDMSHWLIISYDSRYLLAPPYNEFSNYTTFCLVDAKEFEVIGVYDCGFLPGNVTAKYCSRNGIFF